MTVRTHSCCGAAVLWLLTAACIPAAAQQRDSKTGELLLADLPVITATKKTQRITDAPAAVTIITAEDIRASGMPTLIELLRNVPGLDVMQYSRSMVDISIRGFNEEFADKLLVMIDGRSVYRDFLGIVPWSTLPVPLSQIKRIEIIRGPGSALYGANAFCGVINILTKTPAEIQAEAEHTTVRTLVGSQNSQLSEFTTGIGSPRGWSAALSGAYNRTDGFAGRHPAADSFPDDYVVPILTLGVQRKTRKNSLLLSVTETDPVATLTAAEQHTHELVSSLSYTEENVRNPIQARFYADLYKAHTGDTIVEDSNVLDFEIQQQRSLTARHSLVYGASYRYSQFRSDDTGPIRHTQDQWALYLQDDMRLARQTHLFAGLRFDNQARFQAKLSPRLSLVHHAPQQTTLRLSYSQAFRAPNYIDTFGYGTNSDTQFWVANPTLKPETIESYEAGYRRDGRDGYLGLNLFYNQVRGLIINVLTDTAPPWFPPSWFPPIALGQPYTYWMRANGPNATAYGFELESAFRIARGVRGLFNYSYQRVLDENHQPVIGVKAPRHKANLALQTDLSRRWEAYLSLNYVSDANVITGEDTGEQHVQPDLTVNARLGYRFGSRQHPWTLSFVATNLFDNRHVEVIPDTQFVLPLRSAFYFSLSGKF